MLDLIIRGGEVVTPQGVAKADVAIKGEMIAAVAAPGTLAHDDTDKVTRQPGSSPKSLVCFVVKRGSTSVRKSCSEP